MGKITEALKKVTDERISRIQKKPTFQYVVKKVENTSIDEHVVSFHDPTSPITEQYKILRTNIQALKFTKNYKSFVITSAVDGEGKTITSLNLSIAMARDSDTKSVLLIDADMRKGKVSKCLGLKSHPGLSDLLQDKVAPDDVLINTGIKNLTIILSGKPSRRHSELLNSKKMEQLIAMLKSKFDYIFIDTPPVMPLTDACVLGPMVDGAIMVIQTGRTQRDVVKHAEARLEQARTKVLGYVMTNLENYLPNYLYRYMKRYDNYYSYHYKYDQEPVKVGGEL